MKYYFYNTSNKSVKDLINDDNEFKYEITFDSDIQEYGILSYNNSEIELINKDGKPNLIDEPIYAFKVNSTNTSILKKLFTDFGIYFYGEYANEILTLLNPKKKKDEKYYYALLNYYIFESMSYVGIVKKDDDMPSDFLNDYLIDKATAIVVRRYRFLMFKEICKIIFDKFKTFFRKIWIFQKK